VKTLDCLNAVYGGEALKKMAGLRLVSCVFRKLSSRITRRREVRATVDPVNFKTVGKVGKFGTIEFNSASVAWFLFLMRRCVCAKFVPCILIGGPNGKRDETLAISYDTETSI